MYLVSVHKYLANLVFPILSNNFGIQLNKISKYGSSNDGEASKCLGLIAVNYTHYMMENAKEVIRCLLPLKHALKLSNSGAQRGDELRNVSNFVHLKIKIYLFD